MALVEVTICEFGPPRVEADPFYDGNTDSNYFLQAPAPKTLQKTLGRLASA